MRNYYNPHFNLLINTFNPEHLTIEHQKLINSYKTPNNNFMYIKDSRNLNINEVTYDTLRYIITKCYACSDEERYKASIIVIYKMYMSKRYNLLTLNKAKDRAIYFLEHPPINTNKTYFETGQKNTSISFCPSHKFYLRLSIC